MALVAGAILLDLVLILPNHPGALTWGALRLVPLELPALLLGLAALEVGVDLIAEIGVDRLYAKSQALSEFFRQCLGELGAMNSSPLAGEVDACSASGEGVGQRPGMIVPP